MELEMQLKFLRTKGTEKYRSWAKSVNEMYRLYEFDFASSIEEITCYHYRITCGRQEFDFFPMGGKLMALRNNKWITVPKGSLKNITTTTHKMNNEIKFGTKYHLSSDGYSFEYIAESNSINAVLYKDDKQVDIIPAANRTQHNIINHFETKITLGHY